MRKGIDFDVSPDDRRRLEALVRDRNTHQSPFENVFNG